MGEGLPVLKYTLDRPADDSLCPFCDSPIAMNPSKDIWPLWYSRELAALGDA